MFMHTVPSVHRQCHKLFDLCRQTGSARGVWEGNRVAFFDNRILMLTHPATPPQTSHGLLWATRRLRRNGKSISSSPKNFEAASHR